MIDVLLHLQESSYWWHYLSLVPNNDDCSPPMLWAESERARLLEGTGLLRRVDNDLERIEEDFTTLVLPFMQKYQHYFRYENNCIMSAHSQVLFPAFHINTLKRSGRLGTRLEHYDLQATLMFAPMLCTAHQFSVCPTT